MQPRPYDQSDVPVLLKLFTSYILWCIGELPKRDRVDLERMVPALRQWYPHPGEWYEVMEAEWSLLPEGRAVIRQAFEEMSPEVTAEEFTVEWTTMYFEKIAQINKRQQQHARRKAGTRGRKSPTHRQ